MLSIKIPALNIQYYKDYEVNAVRRKLNEIGEKYKSEIDLASALTNVPKEIIKSFIFIESRGDKDAVSGAKAIGLMQLQPMTADSVIVTEYKNRALSKLEYNELVRHLGKSKVDCILSMPHANAVVPCAKKVVIDDTQYGVVINEQDLKNSGLNILVGAMLLGQLIHRYTENGKVRLDKVVVRYNTGRKEIKGNTIEETLKGLPKETRSYILKLLGRKSTLDLLINEN